MAPGGVGLGARDVLVPPLLLGSLIPAWEGAPSHPMEPLAPSRIPAPQELLKKQKSWWENQVCELSCWMGSREVWSLPENSAHSLSHCFY